MPQLIVPVILSGGAGSRLWPLSTPERPKQFQALVGARSLIAETAARFVGADDKIAFTAPIVICAETHVALAREEARKGGGAARAIVAEPCARSTAAAAAIGAALGAEIDDDALVLLAPADHVIAQPQAFRAAIARAAPFARERIVTFGIKPQRAESRYGYVEAGEALGDGVFAAKSFSEKPDQAKAQKLIDAGGYWWNAGIFLFAPSVMLGEFSHAPEIRDRALEALAAARREGDLIRLDAEKFAAAPAAALDKAVMEKTARAAVAPCEMGWADIGAYDELWRLSAQDAAGNCAAGPAAVIEGRGHYVHSTAQKVLVLGGEDLVVIATPEAVIVMPRARAQDAALLHEAADKLDQ